MMDPWIYYNWFKFTYINTKLRFIKNWILGIFKLINHKYIYTLKHIQTPGPLSLFLDNWSILFFKVGFPILKKKFLSCNTIILYLNIFQLLVICIYYHKQKVEKF